MSLARADLVQRRDLLLNMIRAELSSRYRTTFLGVLWFILIPLLWALILTIVFEHLLKLGIPDYPIFVLSALLPWTFFQTGVANATVSVSRSASIIKRVRIPRIFLPVSEVATTLVHFLAALLVLFALMLVTGVAITPTILLLPYLMLIQAACVTGVGLLAASLNVFYRDVEFLTSMALRALFYLTPSFYPLSYVPEPWQPVYLLNPMAGIIESYRQVLLYGNVPSVQVLAFSTVTSLVCLVIGLAVFTRMEPSFEDHI